jgi:hypothetical protein
MKTNEELFKIFIEEGFSKGDITVFDKYASADFVEHQYDLFRRPQTELKKLLLDCIPHSLIFL